MRLKPGIATKRHSITLVAMIGIAAIVGLSFYQLRKEIVSAQAVKTHHVVEAAHGILTHFEAEERAGRMTREAARRQRCRR